MNSVSSKTLWYFFSGKNMIFIILHKLIPNPLFTTPTGEGEYESGRVEMDSAPSKTPWNIFFFSRKNKIFLVLHKRTPYPPFTTPSGEGEYACKTPETNSAPSKPPGNNFSLAKSMNFLISRKLTPTHYFQLLYGYFHKLCRCY